MSRIAKRIIQIPSTVKVNLTKEKIFVEGPLGQSKDLFFPPEIEIINQNNELLTKSENIALAGTYNSLIQNLIKGVIEGYKDIVELKGVGRKVALKDKKLEFSLRKSHPDFVEIPPGLKVQTEGNKITIKGLDKEEVRSFVANKIRSLYLPSIYKESQGIYYLGEEKTIKLRSRKSLSKKINY